MHHNHLSATGEEPVHYTTLGDIHLQVARLFCRLKLTTGHRHLQLPGSTAFRPNCTQQLESAPALLPPLQRNLPKASAGHIDSQLAMFLVLTLSQPSWLAQREMGCL
jgi:hypothetical protein